MQERKHEIGAPNLLDPDAVAKQAAVMLGKVKMNTHLHTFWSNAYRHASEEKEIRKGRGKEMSLWKNGMRPEFFDSTDPRDFTEEKCQEAVIALSYEGMQRASIGFFLLAKSLGLSPLQTEWLFDYRAYKKGGEVQLTIPLQNGSPDGNDAA